jgi:UDP-N-acetylmuramoyl-tripeptide--D-alanyl-D-alanine ligase
MTLAGIGNREDFAIIEVGVNTIGTVDGLIELVIPDIAIVTGIGKIHISGMGSEPMIAHEKCKLLYGAMENQGYWIFPVECLRFDNFKKSKNNVLLLEKIVKI